MLYGFSATAAAHLSAQGQLDILVLCNDCAYVVRAGAFMAGGGLAQGANYKLKMRLEEDSEAAVATLLLWDAARALQNGMATFDEAGANRNNTP